MKYTTKEQNKKLKWKKGYGKYIDKVEAYYDLVTYFETNKDEPKMLNKKKQIKKLMKKHDGNKKKVCFQLLYKADDQAERCVDIIDNNSFRIGQIISSKCVYKAWNIKNSMVQGYSKMAQRSSKICKKMK